MPDLTATVRVRSYELDSFGHVNNSVYLNYLEEARSEYLRQMGLSFDDLGRLGIHLVIVEAFVRYVRPARYGDEIEIVGEFRDIHGARLTIAYTLRERASGQLIAQAWTRGAFFNPATGRPIRAPEPFASAFRRAATPPSETPTL